MITIELMGGLGNQLFQVFALISYAKNNKSSYYIQDKEITFGGRKIYYWDNLLSNMNNYIITPTNYSTTRTIREKRFEFDALPKKQKNHQYVTLLGYFQSYKYFDKHFNGIVRFLNFNEKRELYRHKYDYTHTISMHFRVGDYKNLQNHHPLLSTEYYIQSLQHIINVTGKHDWQVLYFCEDEDVDYVNRKIEKLRIVIPEVSFVKIESSYIDWEQMLIMSLCKHNIIANSTFSWWAAYLSSLENIVCYPKTWFGPGQGKKNMSDMFPKRWVEIDC